MMDYIKTYDNVLSIDVCLKIIEKFQKQSYNQVERFLENHRSFTEINLNNHSEWKNEILNLLIPTFQTYIEKYKRDMNIDDNVWPDKYGFEQIRMKRYLPNDIDEFKFHADVMNHESARRFLVCFIYLNDVLDGGETAFQYNRNEEPIHKVKPEVGRMLIFPPFWTHPHVGRKPISGTKFIIGTYLHYL